MRRHLGRSPPSKPTVSCPVYELPSQTPTDLSGVTFPAYDTIVRLNASYTDFDLYRCGRHVSTNWKLSHTRTLPYCTSPMSAFSRPDIVLTAVYARSKQTLTTDDYDSCSGGVQITPIHLIKQIINRDHEPGTLLPARTRITDSLHQTRVHHKLYSYLYPCSHSCGCRTGLTLAGKSLTRCVSMVDTCRCRRHHRRSVRLGEPATRLSGRVCQHMVRQDDLNREQGFARALIMHDARRGDSP